MSASKFDRLSGLRRNRLLRNVYSIIAGFSLLAGVVVGLDSLVNGSPLRLGFIVVLGFIFIISSSFASYHHLRFMSRD